MSILFFVALVLLLALVTAGADYLNIPQFALAFFVLLGLLHLFGRPV